MKSSSLHFAAEMRGELLLLFLLVCSSVYVSSRPDGGLLLLFATNKLVSSFAAQRRRALRELKSEVRRLRVRHRANDKLHHKLQYGASCASTLTKCHISYQYMFRLFKMFTIKIAHSEISRVFDLILGLFCTFMSMRVYVCVSSTAFFCCCCCDLFGS